MAPDEFARLVKYRYVMDFFDKFGKLEYAALLRDGMRRVTRSYSKYDDDHIYTHIGKRVETLKE